MTIRKCSEFNHFCHGCFFGKKSYLFFFNIVCHTQTKTWVIFLSVKASKSVKSSASCVKIKKKINVCHYHCYAIVLFPFICKWKVIETVHTETYRFQKLDLIHGCLCVVLSALYNFHCNKSLHPEIIVKYPIFKQATHKILGLNW